MAAASANDDNIRRLVRELDAEVSREGAFVHLTQYGGGPDESSIIANQSGYLRLGVELMKAGLAPADTDAPAVKLDLDGLLTPHSDLQFDWCERREAPPPPYKGALSPAANRIIAVGCLLFLLLSIALAGIGLSRVVNWLIH
jgi:hypothetical protein